VGRSFEIAIGVLCRDVRSRGGQDRLEDSTQGNISAAAPIERAA